MIKMKLNIIPVLMYHSIKYKRKNSWIHKHLTLEVEEFVRHVKLFNFLGMKTHFMDQLSDHIEGGKKLNANSILLTFDDGYKDNWIFAYPILKKYNLKGTIWVNPEFVDDNDDKLSPNLFDYWNGKVTLDELNTNDGFLNWVEMREMEKSGLIEIQSHSMSHTKYPISDEIIDFVNPSTRIDWLHWNLFPNEKPFFFSNNKSKIPLGYPIFKSEKANVARKVTECGILSKKLTQHVKENGGEQFFNNLNWKEELYKITSKIRNENSNLFIIESESDYEERMKYELLGSKKILENKLNKKINHICWPFGGWDSKSIQLSRKFGYRSSTAKGIKNNFNKRESHRVDRFAIDNLKYQNYLFYPYAIWKILKHKFGS